MAFKPPTDPGGQRNAHSRISTPVWRCSRASLIGNRRSHPSRVGEPRKFSPPGSPRRLEGHDKAQPHRPGRAAGPSTRSGRRRARRSVPRTPLSHDRRPDGSGVSSGGRSSAAARRDQPPREGNGRLRRVRAALSPRWHQGRGGGSVDALGRMRWHCRRLGGTGLHSETKHGDRVRDRAEHSCLLGIATFDHPTGGGAREPPLGYRPRRRPELLRRVTDPPSARHVEPQGPPPRRVRSSNAAWPCGSMSTKSSAGCATSMSGSSNAGGVMGHRGAGGTIPCSLSRRLSMSAGCSASRRSETARCVAPSTMTSARASTSIRRRSAVGTATRVGGAAQSTIWQPRCGGWERADVSSSSCDDD